MNTNEVTRMYDFTGRTVAITGGTGVLGSEMTRALLGCGANVALLVRNPKKAEQLFSGEPGDPDKVLILKADVLDRDSLMGAAEKVVAGFGSVDCLVNGAGGNNPQATTGAERSFFDIPSEAFRQVLDLNLQGTVFPCQVFGKVMAGQKAGVILNVSSMAAFQPLTKVIAYSAAKAAINNFTQWLAVHMAQEYSPDIRVNALAPGFFLTEQNRFLLTDEKTGALTPRGKSIIDHTPMSRFGNPIDLLGGMLWLLSPASAFVTGIVLPIDGGFNAFTGV